MRTFLTALATSAMLALPASAVTLDFEGLAAGTNVTEVAVGGATGTLSVFGGIGEAWTFDTDNPTGGDSDLAAPFLQGGATPGNVLIIQENDDGIPDDAGAGGTITILFDQAVRFLGFDAYDDIGMTITGSGDGQTRSIFNGTDRGFLAVTGIDWLTTSLTFSFDGNGPGGRSGAIDDLRFLVPVPLPAGLPLLALGLGGLALLRRRRG